METNNLTLGQKIKRYRLVNDIRQEDMAEKMGVSRATLINYEKGHTTINLDVLDRFKKFYQDFEENIPESEIKKPKIIVDGTINLKLLFEILYKSKKFIIACTLLFTILGTSSSFFFKKYYKAEISLYPAKNDNSQGFGQFQALVANMGINNPSKDQNFNIPDVVKSRLIANRAIKIKWKTMNEESIDLISLWRLDRQPWFNSISKKELDSTVIVEKGIKKFTNHIEVNEDKITGLIKISTTFQDPVIASSIANFIGNQVERYIQKENSAQTKKEKLFISGRLLIVKNELEKSEIELKDFKERNRGYEESPELFMRFSQLFREVEAKKEVYLTLQKQLELARIEEVKQSPILHILDHAVPPINKSYPNRLTFLASSLLIGLVFSGLRVIFRY